MKKRQIAVLSIAMLLTSTLALVACKEPAKPLDDAPLKGEVLADFTNGPADEVFAADGWTNGDVFNVWWTEKNVTYSDGAMHLSITDGDDALTACDYYGGEARSVMHYGYGDFEVSMKPVKKNGTASTFFTYTGPSETVDGTQNPHDEIDIEFLGKDTTKVQFNYFVNGRGGHEYMYDLGFDASEEFHTYGYRWTKDYIVWFVDGKPVYKVEASANDPMPSSPGRITMNYWSGTEAAEGWMGKLSDPSPDETADYLWIKTSATGSLTDQDDPSVPDVEEADRFTGDWAAIENADLTFTGSDKYTVTKTDGVTNITYTEVLGNEYINVRAPITAAANEKNWLHLTLENNAETDVQVRVNVIDDALANAEKNKSTNLVAFMDGVAVFTDLEWGGSFFNIPARTAVEAEINFGGTPDSLELMIDSSRNDGTSRAGDVSVSNIKFAKQGEIADVTPAPENPDDGGDLPPATEPDPDHELGQEYTTDATEIVNSGKNDAARKDDTWMLWWVQGEDWNCGSVVTMQEGWDVYSDGVYFTYSGGDRNFSVQLFYDNTSLKANEQYILKCDIEASAPMEITVNGRSVNLSEGSNPVAVLFTNHYEHPDNAGAGAMYAVDIQFWGSETEVSFGVKNVRWYEAIFEGEGAELTFSSAYYTPDPAGTPTKEVTVEYENIKGDSYNNMSADISALAAGKDTFSVKIKNNGTAAVTIRFDIQGAKKEGGTDACNVTATATGGSGLYTDTEWGGTYLTIAAGEEVTLTITYDGAGVHGAVKLLLVYIDSATYGDAATHSGSVTLSDFIFSSSEEE